MTMNIRHSRLQRSPAGFSIVEIMIALALGVIIMLGVTQVATNNSNTRYELDRAGRQIENATYALREMENDITNAGYWGEMGAQPVVTFPAVCPNQACDREADEDLSGAGCELNWAMAFPVQGGSAAFACGTLGTITPKFRTTPAVAKTDYLAVRRANSCALGSTGCTASDDAATANFRLQVNSCYDPNDPNDPIPYALDSDLTKLTYTQRDCATLAPRYRFLNRVYYINDKDQLMRAELVGNQYVQTALVDGVEWMSVEYGMDKDGDGQIDAGVNGYTPNPTSDLTATPPTLNAFPTSAWADVVMARISLVVRNMEPSSGFEDTKIYTIGTNEDNTPITYCSNTTTCTVELPAAYKNHRRQVYSRTVGLRNVAGRRE